MKWEEAMIDEEYLNLVRAHPCIFCGKGGPSSAHHLKGRGWREWKRNDYGTVPVCHRCHMGIHGRGLTQLLVDSVMSAADLVEWVAVSVAKYLKSREHEVGI